VKPVIYVAAPVTGDPVGNAQRAIRWVKWFALKDPSRVYVAPWVAEVLGFANEPMDLQFYQRVLDDDCEVIGVLNGLVGVAGKWSGGMLQERATARALNQPVLDMTKYLEPADVPETFNLAHAWLKVNY
jgi:hypothetical protein